LLAITRAVKALETQPDLVKVDGNKLPKWHYPSDAIVKGDTKETCISAASILAKVTRDARMHEFGLS
jgi:ribonuclease HII